MVFFSELGFGEKGREIERKDLELALWKNLTMVREGIEFAFYDCGKIFRLLIYIYIYIKPKLLKLLQFSTSAQY